MDLVGKTRDLIELNLFRLSLLFDPGPLADPELHQGKFKAMYLLLTPTWRQRVVPETLGLGDTTSSLLFL